jgi:4-alpha-glucanotransferase
MMNRLCGVLCPVSALPSRFGIGDFGSASRKFVDLLANHGFKAWQILPLNPLGYGHSPYQPFSSFALEELYADLDALSEKGLILRPTEYNVLAPKVDYEAIRLYKAPFLKHAYQTEMNRQPDCLDSFIASHPWVNSWALFMMNKRRENMESWSLWDEARREMINHPHALVGEDEADFRYEIWLQKTLYEQWDSLHRYANEKGVKIIGDVPFYVGFDSCDVWASQDTFLLDPETKEPVWIAGVPPDYFSKTGQRWGNPIYDWALMEKRDFSFLIDRLAINSEIYDVIRLDHFRAFDTYWKIPASCPTAVEGKWIEAPGYKFFDLLLKKYPNIDIIAEDLGDLRPQVLTLRDHYNFPGMNVIEFTFHDAEIVHKPGYDKENMVAYLGTHDNDPLRGFYEKLPASEKKDWDDALSRKGLTAGDINERMINYAMSLPARYCIFALQDLLDLGSESRLNVPGVIDDVNWTWRLTSYERTSRTSCPTMGI